MHTVRIYRLTHLSSTLFQRLKAAQMEAAQVWNACCELHKAARTVRRTWPGQNELQQATKGRFALHSQSVQMVVHAFLANIDATRTLRASHPKMRMKYPWKAKRFYPVHWPAQAVSVEQGRVVLPMGRGRPSLVLHLDLPKNSGACTLVWNRGFELHVCIELPQAEHAPGTNHATADLGEIHLAAVTTNTGKAIVVSGRGIRSLKRQRNMRHRRIAKKKDIDYLTHKSKQARIKSFTGSERGTSSQCPECRHKHKPRGRVWKCRKCGFRGHRDLVGSINMHRLAYDQPVTFPRSVTYLRPGLSRRSSRAGTPHASQ
jgi:transposase